jgi:DNA polymerase I-like protein with 3'-5' exonuclease and polymerase domains
MIGCDIETYLISGTAPLPQPICITISRGDGKGRISRDIPATIEFLIETDEDVFFHNGAYDLGCIIRNYPELKDKIFNWIRAGKVHDTMIREQLMDLSTKGMIDRHSLKALALKYCNIDLEKEDTPRLQYHEVADLPLEQWPDNFVEYAIKDADITAQVAKTQVHWIQEEGKGSANTEKLQILAALSLSLIKGNGLQVDPDAVYSLSEEVYAEIVPLRHKLIELGFAKEEEIKPMCPDCGNRRRVKKCDPTVGYECSKHGFLQDDPEEIKFRKQSKIFREHLESLGIELKRTEKGAVSLSKADVEQLPTFDKGVRTWNEYQEYEKLISTYIPQLEAAAKVGVMHPDFDALKETGRTSSYKSGLFDNSTNIQQPPRKEGVRECYVPREGHVYVAIDYGSLELGSTAQALYNLLGWSKMRDYLNQGDEPVDLHSILGARLMSIDKKQEICYNEFKKKVEMGEKEAKRFRQLAKPINLGYPGGIGHEKISQIAKTSYNVQLTPEEAKKLKYQVFFKAFPEIQYYLQKYIPSTKKLDKQGGEYYEYETNGRFRTGCTYNSAANGFAMQSLAADGAKFALANCTQHLPFPIVVFLHDEIIFEMPDDADLEKNIAAAAEIMIDSMQRVLKDVRVVVGADVMDRWTKVEKDFRLSVTYWKNAYEEELYERS